MLNFEIPLVVLKAALICAAKNDVRFYLNGVAIDRGNVVSTDGHRLFYTEIDSINPEMQQVIIPREAVEYLSKKAIGIKDLEKVVKVTLEGAEGKLTIQGTDISESFRAIDGKFPEWKRIIPKQDGSEYEGEYPTFNWQYLVDFQKIAKTLGDKCKVPLVKVTPTVGPSNAVHIDFVDAEFKARGVLMPLRA